MNSEDKLVNVFTGSEVDANFIKTFLEDNGIACLLKNPFQESVIAGWVMPGSAENVQVFVAAKDMVQAKYFVEKFLNEAKGEN